MPEIGNEFADLSKLSQQHLSQMANGPFRANVENVIELLQEDRKQNQILYYVPASERARAVHFSRAKWVGVSGGNGSSKTETCLVHAIALATGIFPSDEELHAEFKWQFRGPINVRIVVESFTTTLYPIILPKLKYFTWTGVDQQGGERGHWGWIPKTSLIDGSWDRSWSEKTKMLTVLCKDPETGRVLGNSQIQFMCFRGDQRVRMADNTWKEIKEIKEGDHVKHPSLAKIKVTKIYQYDDAEMIRVRCRGGKELIVTPNHKHPLENGKLLRTDQLSIGDVIRASSDLTYFGTDSLEEWQLGWVAIMIGDGYIKQRQASFTTNPESRVMKDLPALPPECHLVAYRSKPSGAIDYNISLKQARRNNPLVMFLKDIGLWGKGSRDKFIPDIFFSQSLRNRAYFLKHLWNTDGTINQKGRQACYTTISKRLAYDVKYLLWSLGIKASSHKHKGVCGFTGKDIVKYHTLVSGAGFDRFFAMYQGKEFCLVSNGRSAKDGQITHIEKIENASAYCIDVDAEDHLFVVDGLATHNSKDQESEDFASGDFHLVIHDEPPLYSQWRENQARTMRVGGRIFLSFTWPDDPTVPVDWIYDELYDRAQEPNKSQHHDWYELWTQESIMLDQESISIQAGEWSEETKAVRLRGASMRFSNRIHSLFTDMSRDWCFNCKEPTYQEKGICNKCQGDNTVEFCHVQDFEINQNPCIFLLDPHPRKPHMFCWAQIDPSDDIHIIAEGEADESPDVTAKIVFDMEEDMKIHVPVRLIDPNMGRSPASAKREITWQDEFDKSGLYCELADDSGVGRKTLDEFLKPDIHTLGPRFIIHSRCHISNYQMKRYVWDDYKTSMERDLKQKPRPKYDDFPTLFKYLMNFNPQFTWLHEGPPVIKRPGRRGAY